MGSILSGSLALIALYAVLQPNAAKAANSGAGWLVSALKRLGSPEVAGVPQKAKPAAAAPPHSGGPQLLAPGPLTRPGGVPESTTPTPGGVWI